MATGKPPWSQQYQEVAALFHIGTTKSHPPIPEHLSAEAIDFLLKCLQKYLNMKHIKEAFLTLGSTCENFESEIVRLGWNQRGGSCPYDGHRVGLSSSAPVPTPLWIKFFNPIPAPADICGYPITF
ncbi:hypothetical protein ACSBR1_031746 [Camellia fascicularis]